MLSRRNRRSVNPIGALSAAMNAVRLAQQAYNVGQQLGQGVRGLGAQSTAQVPAGAGPNAPPLSRTRRRNRRRRGGPDQSSNVSAQTVGTVRRATIPRQVQGQDMTTVTAQESLGFVYGSNVVANQTLVIPLRSNRFASVKHEADNWQEFQFLRLRVWYEPTSITTDRGSVLLSPFYRKPVRRAQDYPWRSLSVTTGAVTGPIWSKNGMVVEFDCSRTQHVWYDTAQGAVIIDTQTTPFYLLVRTLDVANGLRAGQIMAQFTVRFAHRDPPGDVINVELSDDLAAYVDEGPSDPPMGPDPPALQADEIREGIEV